MTETHEQHDRKIKELARQYSDQGYTVTVGPKRSQLPVFLRELEYQPDLIAKSPEESFVFEVATSNSAERLARMSKIATIVNKRPKWKFVLVMTNPRMSRPSLSEDDVKSLSDLQQALGDLNDLSMVSEKRSNQFYDMVLLKAWSIIEAAIRLGIPSKRNLSPRSIIRDAVMFGLVSQRDGDFLQDAAELRNRVAHGFRMPDNKQHIQIDRLIGIIQRLLDDLSEIGTKQTDESDPEE